jgi:hypothetical protein
MEVKPSMMKMWKAKSELKLGLNSKKISLSLAHSRNKKLGSFDIASKNKSPSHEKVKSLIMSPLYPTIALKIKLQKR